MQQNSSFTDRTKTRAVHLRLGKFGAILILGLLTVVYTYRGGMKAVVWTEILQASIYVSGGIAAAVFLGRLVPGGWGTIVDVGAAAGKFHLINATPRLDEIHNLWAGLLGGAFLSMASHGADQLIVQRLLACRGLRDAQRALIGSGVLVILIAVLYVRPLGLFGSYRA